jgi:hypothetical protein
VPWSSGPSGEALHAIDSGTAALSTKAKATWSAENTNFIWHSGNSGAGPDGGALARLVVVCLTAVQAERLASERESARASNFHAHQNPPIPIMLAECSLPKLDAVSASAPNHC